MALLSRTGKTGRRLRRPRINFSLKTLPWQVQPFVVHPVLPGETMKNILFQARMVSDPVKNRLLGGWKEYWFFYVRMRDLLPDDYESLVLDPSYTAAAHYSAASAPFFHAYGLNWGKMALELIVKHYFRADDEGVYIASIGGLPSRSLAHGDWMDSVIRNSDFAGVQDVDVDVNADGNITVGEIDQAQREYQLARQLGFTDMDYDDYLRTFGIKVAPAETDKPELLRYVSEWQYPTNTVNPDNGTPSTAFAVSVSERADKDRLFKEPGFIVGITSFRPKVYLANQTGSVTGLMDRALRWLPAMMSDDPYNSLVQIADAEKDNGPLATQTEGYILDLKDLLLYGEQYVNYALASGSDGAIPFPTAGLNKRYPDEATAKSIFSSAEKTALYEDGVVNLSILGSISDTTPPINRIGV